MSEEGKHAELRKMFFPRIAFGTAGLRSRMAPGYGNINDLVVLQTTQGLAEYMLEVNPEAKAQGVVVGYDGRHNSRRFAEITAAVMLSEGIEVHLFQCLTATPLVAYAVKELKLAAGIMITASHNPKDDNGYKLYWDNGAQIIPPHDTAIAASIMANLKPKQEYVFDASHPLLKNPTHIIEKYMTQIAELYSFYKDTNKDAKLKVTFTAMHGVGARYVTEAFRAFDLPAYVDVKEQNTPDPDFSTVKFPNPEEGKGALAIAMRVAEANGSPLIVANDPDADRMAVAERDANSGEWNILNGNQIALLLADWVWTNYAAQHPNEDKSKCVMLASSVSSQILRAMAEKEGFHYEATLTGFKWMGNVASDLEEKGYNFLFAFEVEIGFLIGSLSVDKDGVRTAAAFYEMANQWHNKDITLVQRLDQLYQKYGYFAMTPGYFFCHDPNVMKQIFDRIRNMDGQGYAKQCGEFEIASIRDVTNGVDNGEADGKCRLPATPDAQMLTFRFKNGVVSTLRGSGTEPKLKYYVEGSDDKSFDGARALVASVLQAIIKEFLQPEKNGLVAPSN